MWFKHSTHFSHDWSSKPQQSGEKGTHHFTNFLPDLWKSQVTLVMAGGGVGALTPMMSYARGLVGRAADAGRPRVTAVITALCVSALTVVLSVTAVVWWVEQFIHQVAMVCRGRANLTAHRLYPGLGWSLVAMAIVLWHGVNYQRLHRSVPRTITRQLTTLTHTHTHTHTHTRQNLYILATRAVIIITEQTHSLWFHGKSLTSHTAPQSVQRFLHN